MVRFCVTLAAIVGSTMPASAAQITPVATLYGDTGAAERIESGDYLRTYTQEVAAAACFYHNGVEVDLSSQLMIEARDGFDKHLNALMSGSSELGIIGGESRKKTLAKLEAIGVAWGDIAGSVDALMADSNNSAAITTIKDQNMTVFEMTDVLVTQLEAQYANPAELMQSDVLLMEIAGRQAMMTQKIAKNACKIWSGRTEEYVREQLATSVDIYETSLKALLHGLPELGIQKAPTPEIEAGLLEVTANWTEVRPTLDAVIAGSAQRDDLISLFRHMADEMHKLEEITHEYVEFSKHKH